MTQPNFTPFSSQASLAGDTLLSFINAIPPYKKIMEKELANNGLTDIKPYQWYKQEKFLAALSKISKAFGPTTLLTIGKGIPALFSFPKHINSLERALCSLQKIYGTSHEGDKLSGYKLVDFNPQKQEALLQHVSPYPQQLIEGVTSSLARQFKPQSAVAIDVELDYSKGAVTPGGLRYSVDMYRISWK